MSTNTLERPSVRFPHSTDAIGYTIDGEFGEDGIYVSLKWMVVDTEVAVELRKDGMGPIPNGARTMVLVLMDVTNYSGETREVDLSVSELHFGKSLLKASKSQSDTVTLEDMERAPQQAAVFLSDYDLATMFRWNRMAEFVFGSNAVEFALNRSEG